MILQSLCAYYDVMRDKPAFGYADANVAGCVVLDADGGVEAVVSFAEGKEKSRLILAPAQPKRAGINPKAAFLCDNKSFLFGEDDRRERSRVLHNEILAGVDDDGARAVLAFFEQDREVKDIPAGNLLFRLSDAEGYVHETPAVKTAWERYFANASDGSEKSLCLVTGETAVPARLHGNLPGFGQNRPTIVGFNAPAFESYNKKQGDNAPVSELAAFKYVAALSELLRSERHTLRLGGDKVVFWSAGAEEEIDGLFEKIVNPPKPDEETSDEIKHRLKMIYSGKKPSDADLSSEFCILGMSSNTTRAVIRFFVRDTFGNVLDNYIRHIKDMEIAKAGFDRESVAPIEILLETAVRRKYENIPPLLESALMRAILQNTKYPQSILTAVIARICSDFTVNRVRAGIIKAVLIKNHKRSVTIMLDVSERNPAYLLGRVLAVAEEAQRRVMPKVNVKITEKYLRALVATPRTVFPKVLEQTAYYLCEKKCFNLDGKMREIIGEIPSSGLPERFNNEEQGIFFIGYYHQKQALFSKNKTEVSEDEQLD